MSAPPVRWRVGVEIELLAPRGSSRRALADALAARAGGSVRRIFHPQSELSAVPGQPVFENLTLGFEALDGAGALIARCVDDLTLQDDLDRRAPPRPGWYRVAGDDARLLRLIARHADPSLDPPEALAPAAALFGASLDAGPGGMFRLADPIGAPLAIAAPLPGERERPCELITPPIQGDLEARLEGLLGIARGLGFTAPAEGATHVHFDGARLEDARALSRLVRALDGLGPALRIAAGTNPRCRRLGAWSPALRALVSRPGFDALPWPEARAQLRQSELTKYCDLNLKNLVWPLPDKRTFEVRILPVWTEPAPVIEAARLFEAILEAACGDVPLPDGAAGDLPALLAALPLTDAERRAWLERCA